RVGGAGIPIIDEIDVVADEDFVLDSHPFADEGVTLDLATRADPDALLDFHEGADRSLSPDFAPVEIHEGVNPDVLSQRDVGCDSAQQPVPFLGRRHSPATGAGPGTGTRTPCWSID